MGGYGRIWEGKRGYGRVWEDKRRCVRVEEGVRDYFESLGGYESKLRYV